MLAHFAKKTGKIQKGLSIPKMILSSTNYINCKPTSFPNYQFIQISSLSRCFSINLQDQKERLRRQEVLKIRNEAKQLIQKESSEIEQAKE
jgi:hypothetical protein